MCVFKFFERFRRRVRRFFWREIVNYSTVLTRQSSVFRDELLRKPREKCHRFQRKSISFFATSTLLFERVLHRTQPVFRRNWRCFRRNGAVRSAQFDRWATHLRPSMYAICKLLLLIKMLRNFRTSAPTTAAFFWWFCARNRHFYLWSQQLYALQRRLKVSEFSSKKFIYRPFYERKKMAECVPVSYTHLTLPTKLEV